MTPETVEHVRLALAAGAAVESTLPEAPARAGENRRLLPRFLDRFRVTLATGPCAAMGSTAAQGSATLSPDR